MNVAASLIWAGWPFTLALAGMVAARARCESRRTDALNRGLHELRRPLQVLALGGGSHLGGNSNGPPPLELAICAVADLERAVNGEPVQPRRRLMRLRPVVEGCVERWAPVTETAVGPIGLDWRAGAAAVVADPRRIAQALDNLVCNAVEHASPPISVGVTVVDRGVRVAVSDRGALPLGGVTMRIRPRRSGRRRGHGLDIVARVAAEHGGHFAIRREPGATCAVLELPLASLPLPAAAGSTAA